MSKQNGLSLMEVVITTGIIAVIGVLLLVIIVSSAGVFYKQSAKVSQGLNTNDAFMQITDSIKQSNAIIASYTQGATTYTSGISQLVFTVPSIDASNNIISNTYDYFVFFLDQNQLRFKVFPNASSSRKAQDQIFSTNVDSLQFQYFNLANPPVEVTPGTALKVRVTLALRQKSGANYETKIATAEARLRND